MVFISYSHKDGRNAARHLKRTLEREGVAVWTDTEGIEGGAIWSREIEAAINACDVVLGLLTVGSYQSEVCRAEQLRALRLGKCVIPVRVQPNTEIPLYFEPRNWRDYPAHIPELLADISARNGATLRTQYRQTRVEYRTAPPRVPRYVHRPEALQSLRDTILADRGNRPVSLTALIGMGGIGKTVLVQALCNDDVVQAAFPDGIVWTAVGRERVHPFSHQMREIAKALGDEIALHESDLAAENQYRNVVRDKAGLIVLDDIWSKADLEPFLAESTRSRFLFTTRDAGIAKFAGAQEHHAELLDDAQARELFSAWVGLKSLPASADEVLRECGRLPLALATLGALLRDAGPHEWQDWLSRLQNADLTALESLLPAGQSSVFRTIDVSVTALKADSQARYLALAVLLEDMAVPLIVLQTLWGMDAPAARLFARYLDERSLAAWSSDVSMLRLHDLQLDYVRSRYKEQEALRLIHRAVRLSSQVIENDPMQFTSQIAGRLLPHAQNRAIGSFVEQLVTAAPMPWIRPLHPSLHPPGTELVRTLEGHSAEVHAVAVTPDGKRAVSASSDKTLKVWDLEAGSALCTLEGHADRVWDVALTSDATRAVSASADNTLKVWDLKTGRVLRTLQSAGSVSRVVMTPDGKQAVSASDGTLRVWDLETGRALRALETPSDGVWGIAMTPDGKRAVSGYAVSGLKVWDLEAGCVVRTIEGTRYHRAVAVTADGKRAVSASLDHRLRVWNLDTGQALCVLGGHSGEISDLAVTADWTRAVSASYDKTVKVWDLQAGCAVRTLVGHSFWVDGVAVTADGKLAVSASSDHTLKVWDLDVDLAGLPSWPPEGHSDSVNGVTVTGDGRKAVSASSDKTLKVWDIETGRVVRSLEGHSSVVNDVVVTPDGKRAVSASDDKTLKVWDLDTGRALRTLEGYRGVVYGVALTPDAECVISASSDGTWIWDLSTGCVVRKLKDQHGVHAVSVTKDGKRVISASEDRTLRVWDLETGSAMMTLEGHDSYVNGVAVTENGKRAVSVSSDKTLKVWDLETGHAIRTLEGHCSLVIDVVVTADGRRAISVSGDHTLRVWDLNAGLLVATFHCDGSARCCTVVGQHGIIAGDSSGRLHFLRLEERQQHHR
jgi:WD40 repeat protein